MNATFMIVMSLLSLVPVAFLICSIIQHDDDTAAGSFAFILILLAGGWGMVGLLPTYEQNIDILQPSLSQIARTSDSVIIQIDGQTLVNDSYKVYTTSNDCFKVKRIIKRNAYGIENKREYTILTNVEKT